jgi:hypothetical protein
MFDNCNSIKQYVIIIIYFHKIYKKINNIYKRKSTKNIVLLILGFANIKHLNKIFK